MKYWKFIFALSVLNSIALPAFAEVRRVEDPVSGCAVFTTYTSVTAMSWSGNCSEGLADGDGKVDWYHDEELYWRTLVGPSYAFRLEDGNFILNIAPEDFIITCESSKSISYRSVKIHPKKSSEMIIFLRVMWRLVYYIGAQNMLTKTAQIKPEIGEI